MVDIKIVQNEDDLNEFVQLPFKLYKDNEYWVGPLISDNKKYVTGKTSAVNAVGPSIMAIAKKDGEVVGRILVGINRKLNDYHKIKDSYFSQYESIDDQEVANKLIDFAKNWAKENGSNKLKGPMSLPGGDDNRGFLLDKFDDMPFIQNVYNFEYYHEQMLQANLKKYHDCYAFKLKPEFVMNERLEKIIPYAMQKYKFRLDTIKLDDHNLKKDVADILEIVNKAMPNNDDWVDFMPYGKEEVDAMVNAMKPFADTDVILIARNNEGKPIGFNVTMPDYNQVIRRMNGKMNPITMLKYLYYKRKIDRMRVFILFVVPEYRNKGVTQAMYLEMLKRIVAKGYKEVEGSTIWDYNTPMINDITKLGGKLNKTYRVYQIDL